MFVYAAEVAEMVAHGERLGVHSRFDGVDWPAVRDRVFGRIDPIAESGHDYRMSLPNVTVYPGTAKFSGPREVEVCNETITADRVVIAAGARPAVPDIAGLPDCGFHTSDTIMRLDSLPERLLVLGAGYIAAELGAVMGAFGSEVTFVLRGDTFLRREDHEISDRFTAAYSRRFNVQANCGIEQARRDGGEIVLTVRDSASEQATIQRTAGDHAAEHHIADRHGPAERFELRADELLVATGRIPNADRLNLEAAGVETGPGGYVITDEQCRSTAQGVWALGDAANPVQLKHVANHEARVVRHNLTNARSPATVDHRFIPHAVFGNPQVASVGLTERQCQQQGVAHVSHVQPYSAAAYGWAMEDTESAVKVIACASSRRLLGAHIIGPQASTLIQQLVQGCIST